MKYVKFVNEWCKEHCFRGSTNITNMGQDFPWRNSLFYGTWRFMTITMTMTVTCPASDSILCQHSSVHPFMHTISLWFSLILSYCLCLDIPSFFFPCISVKIMQDISHLPMHSIFPVHLILLAFNYPKTIR